jgi:hypothetical protein
MDGDITDAICLSKGYSLYSDVAGEYPIQFEVSNSAGDTALLPVTVTIYDPAECLLQNINVESCRPKM